MKKKFSVKKIVLRTTHELLALIGLAMVGAIVYLLVGDCYDETKSKIRKWYDNETKEFAKIVADEIVVVNGGRPSYCTEEEKDQDGKTGDADKTGEQTGGEQSEQSGGEGPAEGEQ